MVDHIQGTFKGARGLELFYQAWLPEGAQRAALGIVPGMGDHSGRYDRLVLPLADQGFAVYAFDLRGFGRSPGRRGHIQRWSDYREDVSGFKRLMAERSPGAPVFLLGYSLGSAIVMDTVIHQPQALRGAILIAAPIEPAGVARPWQILLAKTFSRLLPEFTMPVNNDINGVSRDQAVLEGLRTDPLHHNNVTARWGAEVLAATARLRQQAAQIDLPVLFLHGSDDPFNLVRGVEQYYQQIRHPDKMLKIYPGSRHEVQNDLDHAQVASDIAGWMADRT